MTQPRIGLIGGMSWESTEMYYKYFHELHTDQGKYWRTQPSG
jgi:aspartate/glutamate racemase